MKTNTIPSYIYIIHGFMGYSELLQYFHHKTSKLAAEIGTLEDKGPSDQAKDIQDIPCSPFSVTTAHFLS